MDTLETVLYADVLFAINLSMDFISLWAAALLGCKPRRALRMSAAAALGGIYAVVSIVAGIHGLWQYISAAGASFIMCLISFGKCGGLRGLLKQSAPIFGKRRQYTYYGWRQRLDWRCCCGCRRGIHYSASDHSKKRRCPPPCTD